MKTIISISLVWLALVNSAYAQELITVLTTPEHEAANLFISQQRNIQWGSVLWLVLRFAVQLQVAVAAGPFRYPPGTCVGVAKIAGPRRRLKITAIHGDIALGHMVSLIQASSYLIKLK